MRICGNSVWKFAFSHLNKKTFFKKYIKHLNRTTRYSGRTRREKVGIGCERRTRVDTPRDGFNIFLYVSARVNVGCGWWDDEGVKGEVERDRTKLSRITTIPHMDTKMVSTIIRVVREFLHIFILWQSRVLSGDWVAPTPYFSIPLRHSQNGSGLLHTLCGNRELKFIYFQVMTLEADP